MLQHGQVRIHPPPDAVLRTGVLVTVQTARVDLAGYALLPADIGQVVDG